MSKIVLIGSNSSIAQSLLKNSSKEFITFSRELGNFDLSGDLSELDSLDDINGLIYFPGSINLKPFTMLKDQDFQNDLDINFLQSEYKQNILDLKKDKYYSLNLSSLKCDFKGLITKDFDKFLFNPTKSLVDYTKKLGVPVICFPRGISDYSLFCKIVKPDMINIDYHVDPENLVNNIQIPIQGGLDPKVLLTDKANLRNEVTKLLNIFKNHPYVFNLGHGILPETKIEMVEELVKIVRDFK